MYEDAYEHLFSQRSALNALKGLWSVEHKSRSECFEVLIVYLIHASIRSPLGMWQGKRVTASKWDSREIPQGRQGRQVTKLCT